MTRTLLLTLMLALLAAPVALAQHGPPPGYTDPVAYAQDYAAQQAAEAQSDPVGYAASKDPAAEAEHAAWLACWTAYEAAGHALDPACAAYFTAPVSVQPAAGATAEITEVLNGTGAAALAGEALDAVNDTVADPTSALDQAERVVRAVLRFVEDLVGFVLDALGLAGLALAAGLLGGLQGLLDLSSLPVDGLGLAGNALASAFALGFGAVATASSTAGHGVVDAVLAVAGAVAAAAQAGVDGATAALGALGAAAAAVGQGVADAGQAVADGVADAADAVQDGVSDAVHKVASLFDGKAERPAKDDGLVPDTPKTGTDADGLIDRLLGSL